jgi:homoserine dehydrogenase
MPSPIKIGLLGLGTVGQGVVKVLAANRMEIARRAGRDIIATKACVRDLDKARDVNIPLTANPMDVIDDPEIDIVVEVAGGIEPARSWILRAIDHGKQVVTANKALLAHHGNDIFQKAHEKGVMVAFEAAVGGGIPIIKTLREGLSANHIEWLAGIVNGTCNFILTEMYNKGESFGKALQQAQQHGFAEADPTFDVEGIDAAHKLSIMAAIAFGVPIVFDSVYIEGITRITKEDIDYAKTLGYRIKLLAITKRLPSGLELRVHPTFIPEDNLLAHVNGVMNAILVKGDAVGQILSYGAGAGALPTASAVVADLVDVTRMATADPNNRVPHLAFQPDCVVDLPLLSPEAIENASYLRLSAEDRPGVLAAIASIFAKEHISIEALVQKEPLPDSPWATIVMITHKVKEGALLRALLEIEDLPFVHGPVQRIRIEKFDT